jgi:hypothetical protein
MTRKEKQLLVFEILSYLLDNPQASDTLEGITRFWIIRHRVDLAIQNVEGAVKELVDQGVLEERVVQTANAGVTKLNYRLNPERTRDIEDILVQSKAE